MKKTLLLFLLLPFFGFAQLSGDYIISNANPNADFKTLVSAVAKLNAVGVTTTGPVVRFLLDENQTVSSQLTITQFANTSATRTVTIKPNDGKDILISGMVSGGSVIAFNNADNIIIDGNNSLADNKLKIYNTFNDTNNSYTNRAGVWFYNGSDNNKIQNLSIELYMVGLEVGTQSVGIFAGGNSLGNNGNNLKNTIKNVTFTKVKQAIVVKGQDQNNTEWNILNNKIGATDANKPFLGIYILNASQYNVSGNIIDGITLPSNLGGSTSHSGIYLENSNNGVVSKNTLSSIDSQKDNSYTYGIYVKGNNALISQNTVSSVSSKSTVTGAFGVKSEGNDVTISGNKISSVFSTVNQGKSTCGIYVSGNNQLVSNNYVNDVASYGGGQASTQDGFGIYINAGTTIKLYHNSVRLSTIQPNGSSAALFINDGTALDIRNNIFVNAQPSGSLRFAIFSQVTDPTRFTNLDYNTYKSTQDLGCFGSYSNATNRKNTLALWQAATSRDGNSKEATPVFANSTLDLDTANAVNNTLIGTPDLLPIIINDINGSLRLKPNMGAYEIATCTPQGNQIDFGSSSWKGYVYKWTGTVPNPAITDLPANTSTAYIGTVTEPALFDRDFDSTGGALTGTTMNICGTAPSDNFFIRYKMSVNLVDAGEYSFTIGGDDGTRLYIDGVLLVGRWNDHGYTKDSAKKVLSAGPHEFVLEYYENIGGARVSFSYGIPKGDPTVFGINTWNVYGYNVSDISLPAADYAGTYVDSNLSFDTTLYWNKGLSPSAYAGWQGLPMPINDFALSYKRQGFPCGNYKLDLANFDDDVEIYIDGTRVFNQSGYQTVTVPVGTFLLNKNSKVEVRLKENGGDANLALNFTLAPNVYNGTGPAPTATTPITIASNLTLQSDVVVCSCTINPGVILTVPTDKTLTVYEDINVGTGGKLLVQSGGALLQNNTSKTLFTGDNTSFELQRITPPVRRYDLTFWSSPLTTASGFKLYNLSPETLGDKYYIYNSLTESWITDYNGGTVMVPGKGYVVRAPQTFDVNTTKTFQASFIGIPNNGDIALGTLGAKWNFGGNPYPSALDAKMFITVNGNVGSLYLWTHSTAPSDVYQGDGIYNYNSADYAVFNLTGTAATTAPTNIPLGYIAAGQGFFFKPSNSNGVTFTNDMRVAGNNKQFFKTENDTDTDRSRVWLNLTNAQGAFKQALIGYLEGATNSWDINYDAETISGNSYIDFYSVNDSRKLTVQGRAIPFDDTEVVPLGYKTTVAGDFTIAIDHADGLFTNHAVYLEDKKTGNVQNLAAGNYTFTTAIGTFTDRFVLHYTSKNLGTGDFENPENTVLVSVKDKAIKIAASNESIKDVAIFDITGKQLYTKTKIGAAELQISNLQSGNQVLLVKVTLENDFTTTKKVIFN